MGRDFRPQSNITELLQRWSDGDPAATDELVACVYDELRVQAARYLGRERPEHTLQTTALVHEAYLKLIDQREVVWESRGHFFAIAAQAMRRILLDHAKKRRRGKRGGGVENIPFDEALTVAVGDNGIEVEILDDALTRLARINERTCKIVELRYFAGLSVEETADVLGISKATVAREWQVARAWLYREISG